MKFQISGTVYYADGFDLAVEAETEAKARAKAMEMVEGENGYKFDPQLQEICIECVEELQ
jgi:HD-GYP domain-containing protein (c-di-GMP phosphodiesterase class II)